MRSVLKHKNIYQDGWSLEQVPSQKRRSHSCQGLSAFSSFTFSAFLQCLLPLSNVFSICSINISSVHLHFMPSLHHFTCHPSLSIPIHLSTNPWSLHSTAFQSIIPPSFTFAACSLKSYFPCIFTSLLLKFWKVECVTSGQWGCEWVHLVVHQVSMTASGKSVSHHHTYR